MFQHKDKHTDRNNVLYKAMFGRLSRHLASRSSGFSWLAPQEVVSSTLSCAPVAHWGVTAWAANNRDSYYVAVLGRRFTHRGGA